MSVLKNTSTILLCLMVLGCGSDSPGSDSNDQGAPLSDTGPADVALDQGSTDSETIPDLPPDTETESDLSTAPDPGTEPDPGAEPDLAPTPDSGFTPDPGSTPDTAEIPPPATFEMGDGCAEPLDYTTTACEEVVCPAGHVCMGGGHCVPNKPFLIEPVMGQSQSKMTLAHADNGGFAAAWYEVHWPQGQTQQDMDIYFGVYNADGSPSFVPVKLDTDVLPWARSPTMVRLDNGNYVVIWREQAVGSDELQYFGRIVSPLGIIQSDLIELNETSLNQAISVGGNMDAPVARLLRSGDVAIAWMGRPVGKSDSDVFARILSANGDFVTGELDTGAATDAQEGSAVVTDTPQHGLVLLWQSRPVAPPGDKNDPNFVPVNTDTRIYARHFNSSFIPLNEAVMLGMDTGPKEEMPGASTFESGELLVSWRSKGGDPTTPQARPVHSRLYNLMGDPMGDYQAVGDDNVGLYPFNAPVNVIDKDRAAVVWHTLEDGLDGVFLRRYYLSEDAFDCDITPIWGPMLPNELGARHLPDVLGFPDGRILTVWSSTFDVPNASKNYTRIVLKYLK